LTVCISAIADGGAAVVVAADRMMTFGPPMNLQAEGAVRKIIPLSDSHALLFSGSVPDAEAVVNGIKESIQHGTNLKQIADFVAKSYQNLKRKKVEDSILRPLIGIEFAQFQQLVSQSASSQVLTQMLGMISQHNLGLDVMLAGVDEDSGHIAIVAHPGTALLMDTVGVSSIGSGSLHASVRLSLGRQTRDLSILETIFNVYEAKKASEVAPGVGKVTDIAVITGRKTAFLPDSAFDVLGSIVKERPALDRTDIDRLREACGDAANGSDKT
jgi:20S proteasome alpha/beta subunit